MYNSFILRSRSPRITAFGADGWFEFDWESKWLVYGQVDEPIALFVASLFYLSKQYNPPNGIEAVKNISFTIQAGVHLRKAILKYSDLKVGRSSQNTKWGFVRLARRQMSWLI
jgi:hypothetical protein